MLTRWLMRISILTATSAWGGLESHAVALAKAARNRGHKVVIVELGHTVYDDHLDQVMGIDVIHMRLPRSLEELGFNESFKLLKALASDVAVFEKGELDSANWRFDLAARVCFKRYITIEQLICAAMPPRFSRSHFNGLLPGFGLWWYRTFWNRYARSLTPHSIVCVSEAVRLRLVNDYRFSPQKTVTINNGIRTSKFRPDPQLRAAARCVWQIPENDLVFGAVGRLAPVKGYDLAIKTGRLSRRYRSWLRKRGLPGPSYFPERQSDRGRFTPGLTCFSCLADLKAYPMLSSKLWRHNAHPSAMTPEGSQKSSTIHRSGG
jgi:glycosyltransferase involved in cell wall biosynthesis